MNGPTRSRSFDRRFPLRAGAPDPFATTLTDELDQFVDAEPVTWARRRPDRSRPPVDDVADIGPSINGVPSTHSDPEGLSTTFGNEHAAWDGNAPYVERAPADPAHEEPSVRRSDPPIPHWEEEPVDAVETVDAAPAFSSEPAMPAPSARHDAFAKRLHDELSRSPQTEATDDPPRQTREPSDGQAAPARAPRQRTTVLKDRPRTNADKLRLSRANHKPAAASRNAGAPPPVPTDPLEEELDNAIGAILTGRPLPEPSAQPKHVVAQQRDVTAPVDVEAVTGDEADHQVTAPSALAPEIEGQATSPVLPPRTAKAIGGGTLRKVPVFNYERREEPEDDVNARIVPDPDDPLGTVFLPDHTAGVGQADADPFDEATDVAYDDDLFDTDIPDASLPPSLRRTRTRRRPSRRSATIAAGVVGLGIFIVLGVIGLNVFGGGNGEADEPRIIRADAADVKVRPETTPAPPPAEIDERADVTEDGTLVMPDDVTLTPSLGGLGDLSEDGPRQVRTVVLRPDGTRVPTGGDTADARSTPPQEQEQEQDSGSIASEPTRSVAGEDVGPDAKDAARLSAVTAPQREAPSIASVSDAAVQAPSDAVSATQPAPINAPPGVSFGSNEQDGDGTGETVREEGEDAVTPEALVSEDVVVRDIPIPAPRPTPPQRVTRAGGPLAFAEPGAGRVSSAGQSAAASAASAPWGVQVASRRDRADAERSFRALQQRYPSLLSGQSPMIIAADVPGRGRFFRVRIGTSSRQEAARLCDDLKRAGADCFIGRN